MNQLDGRKLEVVVDGLPQLAIDTTMVSQFEATALLVQGQPHSVARCQSAAANVVDVISRFPG